MTLSVTKYKRAMAVPYSNELTVIICYQLFMAFIKTLSKKNRRASILHRDLEFARYGLTYEKRFSTNGPMAQLVARTTPDRKVVRSSRAGLIPIFFCFFFFLYSSNLTNYRSCIVHRDNTQWRYVGQFVAIAALHHYLSMKSVESHRRRFAELGSPSLSKRNNLLAEHSKSYEQVPRN
ncbi:hypothetical protein ASPTUDRAFT_628811 [Aspergillus tubingensis CBS 134.48]|uniref:Uncharacterized protein n=1 Tax=Aspergillus tubingensis (strain CBS 134.48) TaxID=767770 RepID=A0A1L9N3R1_ASPTC|nr:hypothetical protein ASPTUDRAFT_628811 [Aspergillus tubingensis CBS 134.48]